MRRIGTGTVTISPLAREYINDVLDRGWLSYGDYSRRFEEEFARLHGCKYGILSNSGTSSLLVALQAMKEIHGWQPGDEVIVPALTFVASVNVILQNGLKPVLVDVEREYYCIDSALIEKAITKRTRAIMPVHTFGQPCCMGKIDPIATLNRLKILADSCEAMFVQHRGGLLGQWADITCFSTYAAHILVTGVGGLSITDNPGYAKTMRSLTNHGMSYDDLSGGEDGFRPTKTRRDFTFDRIGHSFRITELEAALGLAQLQDWRTIIGKRMLNADYLTERLTPFEDRLQLPKVQPYTQHAYMMFPLVCREPGVRDKLTRHLEQHGIETRRMLPLTCQPVYREWCNEDDYPVAKWINENGFYTGIHQSLTTDDLDYVSEKIGDFFGSQ